MLTNQKGYDRAVKLLEELEDILDTDLQVYAYDGELAVNELWWKFATEDEKAERLEKKRQLQAQYDETQPYGKISAQTARWAEAQMLKHAHSPNALQEFLRR